MSDAPTILVVEDEVAIRASLADALRLDHYRVLEAATMAEARSLAAHERIELALLDVRLPDGNGLELIADLRARNADVLTLVLTARGSEEDRVFGFEHGCDDYVVKPFSLREVKLRIAALLRRRASSNVSAPRARGEVRIGGASVDLDAYQVRRGGACASLSPKERDLLFLFLAHPGTVITRNRFLNEVWGYESFPTTRTVDMHVLKLRQKIEADADHPRHFVTVHGAGYRFDP